MKYLVIDDSQKWIESLRKEFSENSNVFYCQCFTVMDALVAIEECTPDVIFVDHELSKGGSEGLVILKNAVEKGIEVYSTSAINDIALAVEYLMAGATAYLGKNIEEIKKIIS